MSNNLIWLQRVHLYLFLENIAMITFRKVSIKVMYSFNLPNLPLS
jgi:hypothetical protein